ncbi:hypothetical protein D3C86_1714800 [compost metagenome]
MFDNVKAGDEVEVAFNLRGRPWTDKTGKTSYFNSMVVWRLNVITAGSGTAAPTQTAPPVITPEDEDPLPF